MRKDNAIRRVRFIPIKGRDRTRCHVIKNHWWVTYNDCLVFNNEGVPYAARDKLTAKRAGDKIGFGQNVEIQYFKSIYFFDSDFNKVDKTSPSGRLQNGG